MTSASRNFLLLACGIHESFCLRVKVSQAPQIDLSAWTELDGTSYLASFEKHRAKYPQACKFHLIWHPANPDKTCSPGRLNKIHKDTASWDSKSFLKQFVGKTVLFIGDSMIQQLFARMVCMNGEHVVNISGTDGTISRNKEVHRVTFKVDGQEITFLSSFLSAKSAVGQFSAIHRSADITVLSTGSHFRSKEEFLMDLQLWHQLLAGQKLLYMEYSATHFDSPSGDYEDSIFTPQHERGKQHSSRKHLQYLCKPINVDNWKASKSCFRRSTANEFFEKRNVTIVYNFDATVPIHEQHLGGDFGDCRHFCNPSPVLDMRINKLDEAIKELLK